MCFTGGLVLALMADPFVTAPVMCQPALPLKPFGDKSGLGVSPEELKAAKDRKIPVLALRFTGDTICSENRIERLRNEFGECFRFIPVEPPADKPDAHSIITEEWTRNPNQSIRDALDAVVRFLKSQSAS